MGTMATLVVGQDGATTKNGSSKNISSSADREIFLARRRNADVIIIGGNTARNEPYTHTPGPLIICSRSSANPVPKNEKAQVWNCSPGEAIDKACTIFGQNILIEGGAQMIVELIESQKIDHLELSMTQVVSGENVVDWQYLLSQFKHVEMKQIEKTQFFSAFN